MSNKFCFQTSNAFHMNKEFVVITRNQVYVLNVSYNESTINPNWTVSLSSMFYRKHRKYIGKMHPRYSVGGGVNP